MNCNSLRKANIKLQTREEEEDPDEEEGNVNASGFTMGISGVSKLHLSANTIEVCYLRIQKRQRKSWIWYWFVLFACVSVSGAWMELWTNIALPESNWDASPHFRNIRLEINPNPAKQLSKFTKVDLPCKKPLNHWIPNSLLKIDTCLL